MQITPEIRNRLVKVSFGRSLFPETTKAVTDWWSGPDPKSPEGVAGAKRDDEIKNQAIMTALRMAGVGLVAGGGVRLLQEGYNRFLRKPDIQDAGDEITIDIHRPGSKRKRRGRTKYSALGSVKDVGWYYPAAIGATGLGLYGGYKGVRGIANWLKKRELEADMTAAKQEFEDALDEQFAASRVKSSELHTAIDSAYEEWRDKGQEKQALIGEIKGGVIGTAALIWLLSHAASFSRVRKADPEAFRKKVLLRQRRMRQAASPPPILFEFPEGEDEEEDKPKRIALEDYPEEKAAAAPDHACGSCEYFNGGVCAKQDRVKGEVGEDNLTIYLSNPTKTNSCPVFDAESIKPTKQDPDDMDSVDADGNNDENADGSASLVLSSPAKQAGDAGGATPTGWWQQAKDFVLDAPAKVKGFAQEMAGPQLVRAAGQAANDPKTLQPAAQEIASNTNVQEGMNEGAMEAVQKVPLLGSLFG